MQVAENTGRKKIAKNSPSADVCVSMIESVPDIPIARSGRLCPVDAAA